jgi:hypothetical protein
MKSESDILAVARSPQSPDEIIRRLVVFCHGRERCPECRVPRTLSTAADELGPPPDDDNRRPSDADALAARLVRLAAGLIVGEDGMEDWLECGTCQ